MSSPFFQSMSPEQNTLEQALNSLIYGQYGGGGYNPASIFGVGGDQWSPFGVGSPNPSIVTPPPNTASPMPNPLAGLVASLNSLFPTTAPAPAPPPPLPFQSASSGGNAPMSLDNVFATLAAMGWTPPPENTTAPAPTPTPGAPQGVATPWTTSGNPAPVTTPLPPPDPGLNAWASQLATNWAGGGFAPAVITPQPTFEPLTYLGPVQDQADAFSTFNPLGGLAEALGNMPNPGGPAPPIGAPNFNFGGFVPPGQSAAAAGRLNMGMTTPGPGNWAASPTFTSGSSINPNIGANPFGS